LFHKKKINGRLCVQRYPSKGTFTQLCNSGRITRAKKKCKEGVKSAKKPRRGSTILEGDPVGWNWDKRTLDQLKVWGGQLKEEGGIDKVQNWGEGV